MTANELVKYQIEEAGFMLDQVLKDWPAGKTRIPTHDSGMTAHQQVAHLAECYVAVSKKIAGEEHEWGTYSPTTDLWEDLLAEFADLRGKAAAHVEAATSDETIKLGIEFVVTHDQYHVGQLCSLRISIDPEWNAYSIYR